MNWAEIINEEIEHYTNLLASYTMSFKKFPQEEVSFCFITFRINKNVFILLYMEHLWILLLHFVNGEDIQ